MFSFGNISAIVTRGALLARKVSPTGLLILGLGGIVVGTVMACNATLKVEEIIDTADEKMDNIESIHADEAYKDRYSERDYQKDKMLVKVRTIKSLVKIYGPAVLVMVVSGAAIVGGHHILTVRNAGLAAGLKVVSAAFEKYRGRVVLAEGQAKDDEYRYGIVQKQITETVTDEDGKEKKVKKAVNFSEETEGSMYARYFQPGNPSWGNNLDDNLYFIQLAQNHANDLIKSREIVSGRGKNRKVKPGHVFLNEVYESLNLPHSDIGALVGWVRGSEVGDKDIDFGIKPIISDLSNGLKYAPRILLDFNVDGVIWNLI
jgi:hypothetical protein